jgi:hypothetical protein
MKPAAATPVKQPLRRTLERIVHKSPLLKVRKVFVMEVSIA